MIANRVVKCSLAVLLGVVLLTTLSLAMTAQEGKKEDRVSGRVHMVNKDTSTITVRVGTNNVHRLVVYDANTKFTKDNKPGTLADVTESARVVCVGKFDDKARLMARQIEVRPGQ